MTILNWKVLIILYDSYEKILLYLYLKSYALGYIVYNAIWHLGSLKVQPANFQLKDLMRSSYKKLNDNFSLNVLEFNFFLVQT